MTLKSEKEGWGFPRGSKKAQKKAKARAEGVREEKKLLPCPICFIAHKDGTKIKAKHDIAIQKIRKGRESVKVEVAIEFSLATNTTKEPYSG